MPTLTIDLSDDVHDTLLALVDGDPTQVPSLVAEAARRAASSRARLPTAVAVRAALTRLLPSMVGHAWTVSQIHLAIRINKAEGLPHVLTCLADLGWVPVRNNGPIARWAHKDAIPYGYRLA